MKYIITISFLISMSLVNKMLGQESVIDGVVKFENTVDIDAQPNDSIANISKWFLSNMNEVDSYCLERRGTFYYEIYILSNGRVTKWTLINEMENESCLISEVESWKVPFWKPAIKNGENCNQHLRLKTYIDLE